MVVVAVLHKGSIVTFVKDSFDEVTGEILMKSCVAICSYMEIFRDSKQEDFTVIHGTRDITHLVMEPWTKCIKQVEAVKEAVATIREITQIPIAK